MKVEPLLSGVQSALSVALLAHHSLAAAHNIGRRISRNSETGKQSSVSSGAVGARWCNLSSAGTRQIKQIYEREREGRM